jgi:PAS domain S-box-containing protein
MTTALSVLLVVEDTQPALTALERAGFDVHAEAAQAASSLVAALRRRTWDVLVAADGVAALPPQDTLRLARQEQPGLPVLLMTSAAGELSQARRLLQAGAADVLPPAGHDQLPLAVARQIDRPRAAVGSWLRRMLAGSQAIMLLLDPQTGAVLDANPAASAFYGWEADTLRQMTLLDLNAAPGADVLAELEQAMSEKRARLQFRHRLAGGEVRDLEAHTSPLDAAGRRLLYAILHDVTERLARERELEAISTLGTALREAQNLAGMLPIILEHTQGLLEVPAAALALADAATGEVVMELARDWLYPAGTRLSPGSGVAGRVIASRRPYWGVEGDERAALPPAAIARGLKQVLAVPLLVQQRAIGALCVGSRQALTAAHQRVLEAIAHLAASAIQRARLHEQTQQRLQRLDSLHAIDIAISSSFDLRVTLNIFLDHLAVQLGVDAAAVLLLNPGTQTLEYAAVRGLSVMLTREAPMRLSDRLAGHVAAERQRLHLADMRTANTMRGPESSRRHALSQGFVAYYGMPLMAKGRVQGVLEVFHRSPLTPDSDWLEFLGALATQAAIAIDNATLFSQLQRSNLELNLAYDATIEGWARVLEARGIEPGGHALAVAEVTVSLARAMGIAEAELVHVRRGALLHDIGMLGVPESVVLQPGRLTEPDRALMQRHPEHAFDLLAHIGYLRPALDIPWCHHERWDGSGYLRGLRGELIPLAARVFAVVDVWSALTSQRPYRPAWAAEQARAYLREQAGQLFDARVVEAFLGKAWRGSA